MKTRIIVSAVLSVLLLAALTANVHAAEVKITASDGAAYDWFGMSVAISGDCAVVGAPNDDDAGSNSGSAYIFKRNGTTWTQEAKITASDGAADDRFGLSVAISGDYAVVGARHDGDSGLASGSAYIFKRDGTEWTEQAKITASDGAACDNFGGSVAISGDSVVVGADGDNDPSNSGSAYIFKRDGTSRTAYNSETAVERLLAYIFKRDGTKWTEQTKINASDGAAWDYFGGSVAISGDYAVVSAREDDDVGSSSGSAYIFKRNGTEWTEQAKITASDGAADDDFGRNVAISGDYAIVSARGDDDAGSSSGSAYIFKRDGTKWTEQTKINASDGTTHDWFGYSVAISGDYAVVGAIYDGAYLGSAYIFKRNGTAWTEQVKINASDGTTRDWFGVSVAISGDYAVVGAYGDDDAGWDSGSAYIYTIGIFSCDSNGDPKDQFAPGETIHVTGTNHPASTTNTLSDNEYRELTSSPTVKSEKKPNGIPTSTKNDAETPAFEAISAIAGLLAVVYILRRKQ